MGGTFESAWKNKFDYFFLQEHGFFNDSSKYGNVNVSGLKVNEKDGYVNVTFKLCLVVIKNNTGFLEDVIKRWKKFGKESVTEQEFQAGGECSFCCNGSFTYTIPDNFLFVTKSYLWYEGQRLGTGTSRSQTSNIVLRELLAERAWCTISILTFPHQVGSSPRPYPSVYIATRSGRNLSDMWRSTFNVSKHSRPQSPLGAWARGPGGSGDTGFKVLDFWTSGHFRIKLK